MDDIDDSEACCLCSPLSYVAYCKIACSFGVSFLLVCYGWAVISFRPLSNSETAVIMYFLVLFMLELIFNVLFLCARSKKNLKCLWIYYGYLVGQLLSFLALVVLCIISVGNQDRLFNYKFAAIFIGAVVALFIMGLHVYFMVLVRRETRILELNTAHVQKPTDVNFQLE